MLVIKRILEISTQVNIVLNSPDTPDISHCILSDNDISILIEINVPFKHIEYRMNKLENESFPSFSELIPSLEEIKSKLEEKKIKVKNQCVKDLIDVFIEGMNKRKPSYSNKEWIPTYLNPNYKSLSAFNLDYYKLTEIKKLVCKEAGIQLLQNENSQNSASLEDCVLKFMDNHQNTSFIFDEISEHDRRVINLNVNPLE